MEDSIYNNISQQGPEMEQEIRQLAKHALKIEESFTLIEIRFQNTRHYSGMQGAIAIETDNLIEEWKTLKEAST